MQKIKNSLIKLFPSFDKKIWGLSYEDISFDDMIWRGVHIYKKFYFGGRNAIGLNKKFIQECWKDGVSKLVIFIGESEPYDEYLMDVPSERLIGSLEKQKQYEDRPSNFEGGQDMRIYYIRI